MSADTRGGARRLLHLGVVLPRAAHRLHGRGSQLICGAEHRSLHAALQCAGAGQVVEGLHGPQVLAELHRRRVASTQQLLRVCPREPQQHGARAPPWHARTGHLPGGTCEASGACGPRA